MSETRSTSFSQTSRFFITMAAIGISVFFLREFRDLFNAFFLAQLVVLTASPVMYWLRQRNMPSWLSLLVGLVLTLSVTMFIAAFIFLTVIKMIDLLPVFADALQQALASADGIAKQLSVGLGDLLNAIDTDRMVEIAGNFLQGVLQSVSVFGLMMLIIVFLVVEAMIFPDKVNYQIKSGNVRFSRLFGFTDNMRQYVGITSLLGLGGGFVATIALWFIGVQFAGLWGMLYFVMNFVPMVGFWIALIPPVLIALATLGFGPALLVFLIYIVMSTIINQGLRPHMLKGGLDLSPLWSILSLVVWSTILGAPGLIIGIPITIAVKELILENDPESRWVSDMLGSGDRPEDE